MQRLTTSYFPHQEAYPQQLGLEPVLLEESESTFSTSIASEPVWKLTNGAWRFWILEMMQFAWFSS